jgi:hypothetical protein
MRRGLHHLTSPVADTRPAARATFVVLVAFAMLAVTLFTPAMATSGDDDVEGVRASVMETFNYKIGLLDGLRSETDNADRIAAYSAGIAELVELRDTRVATETSIDELWALRDRAHAIYHTTVDAANAVASSPAEELAKAKRAANETIEYKIGLLRSWIDGCDDPTVRAIVSEGIARLEALFGAVEAATSPDAAYALKDSAHSIYHSTLDAAKDAKGEGTEPKDEPKPAEKTEAEKAAEALAAARRDTRTVIERRTAILRSAAAAARIPQVVEIYETAADDVAALDDEAKAATTTAQLADIEERAVARFEAAKQAATSVRDDEADAPSDTLATYLASISDHVIFTVDAAEPTATSSPETFANLVEARDDVLGAVEAVADASESGRRLDDRWHDLESALSSFRRALIVHYVTLGEPMMVAGIHIPG